MDNLWVVAAAAGAGYVAKNLQTLSLDKEGNSREPFFKYSVNIQSESRNFLQKLRDKTCPLRRLAGEWEQDDAFFDVENHLDVNSWNEIPNDYNLGWISSLDFEEASENRTKKGKIIRCRKNRDFSVRPINSLQSGFDAQLCREHENVEEKMSILVPSISRSNSDSSFIKFENLKANDTILRFASVERFEFVKKLKKSVGSLNPSSSSDGASQKSSGSQGADGKLLLIIGMTIGILSTQFEVHKLNQQLKQTKYLVQDLHEELDMKEMVTVKEISDEGYLLQEPTMSRDAKTNNLAKFQGLNANDQTTRNSELLSKIEAELEAELEVLERNMKASARERIFNFIELDQNFEPDIIQGDLNSLMNNGISGDSSVSGSETIAPKYFSQPVNYAVCPYELSLHLYELIEYRLEERIKELEIELGNTISLMEANKKQENEDCLISHNNNGGIEEDASMEFVKDIIWDEQHIWSSFMLNEEDDDDTDESEMLLLKHI